MWYVDATGLVQTVSLGANGLYLKSQGAGAAFTWDTPAGGGGGSGSGATTFDAQSGYALAVDRGGAMRMGIAGTHGILTTGSGETIFISATGVHSQVTSYVQSQVSQYATIPNLALYTSYGQLHTVSGYALDSQVSAFVIAQDQIVHGQISPYVQSQVSQYATKSEVNPKAFSQAVNMTYAAAGSNGITVADNDNIDFGTGDFTLVWKGSLPIYPPAITTMFELKIDANYGYLFSMQSTTGLLRVEMDRNDAGVEYFSTVAPTIADNTVHEFTAVIIRETATVNGSVVFYVDGVQIGASVTITAVNPPITLNTIALLYTLGTSGVRNAGTVQHAITYNRALTAAEVLSL
jgi:hypothetical protein